jgi:hypothetical protein
MVGSNVRRVLGVLMAAVAFGIAMSILKGNGAGVRDAIGNVSAPWLLLPFIAGAAAGRERFWPGALVGLLASLAALGGFYVANSFVLDLGPHPWLVDLRLAVEGGRTFFALGLLSGPVFGAVGAAWQRRGRPTVLGVLVASSLVFEPLGWLAYEKGRPSGYASDATVWGAEVLLGVVACVVAMRLARATGRRVDAAR